MWRAIDQAMLTYKIIVTSSVTIAHEKRSFDLYIYDCNLIPLHYALEKQYLLILSHANFQVYTRHIFILSLIVSRHQFQDIYIFLMSAKVVSSPFSIVSIQLRRFSNSQ